MPKVIINRSLSKEEEINILQSLKGTDSYFHQFFSDSDIDRMCENIRNDFQIQSGCSFMLNNNFYERQFNELCKDIISNMPPNGTPEDIYEIVAVRWGMRNIITYKHGNGMPLTKEEIDYLIENLN